MARSEPSDRDLADLAALADGTLPEARRAAVEARVAASPDLQAALSRQRAALATIAATGDLRAPQTLRTWLAERSPAPTGPRIRSPWLPRIALAGMAAAVALAVVLALGGPSPADELAGATARAEADVTPPDTARHFVVDDIAFPDGGEHWDWTARGADAIQVDGQGGLVVAYERGGRRLDYAIVGRPKLDLPGGTGMFRSFTYRGRRAVMWHRKGRTCLLLGGKGVDDATLRRLAHATEYY